LASERTPAKVLDAEPEAIAELREAIRLDPDEATWHLKLSYELGFLGRKDEATAACREAVRVRPDKAGAHADLGYALHMQGKLDEALAAYREAIRLKPDERIAQCNLGGTLAELGRLDEGIAAYREALRLMPYFRSGQRELALLLRQKGDFTGSLAEYRKFREMVVNRPYWSDESVKRVELAERMVAVAHRLPGIVRGDDRPKDNAERILFARMFFDTKRYVAAARLYAEALESDPGLVRDRGAGHGYRAVRAPVLAAAGWGKDEPPLDESHKVMLRGQALVRLKAELAGWDHEMASGPPQTRSEAFFTLLSWRSDGYLASVREPEALAKLRLAERKAWEAFWAEVRAVINRAGASGNRSHDLFDENEDIR
jgi:tetratricopeptide (TPR) repeat protein